MTANIKALLLAALCSVAAVSGAQACSVARVAGSEKMVPVEGRINQGLIDAAIRAEVNYHRCKAGLRALSRADGLTDVAAAHAKWMARSQSLSHKSQVAGQTTLKARMSSSGIRFRAGSENIGMVHRYAIDGTSFKIHGACSFSTYGGQPIGAHSYRSLASHVVKLWMASKGHRKNILDRKVSMLGSGAAFTAKAPYCGQIFVSQNFAG